MERGWPVEAGKGEETRSPLEPSMRTADTLLLFGPVRPPSDRQNYVSVVLSHQVC